MKICQQCKQELPLSEYWGCYRTKDKLHYQCRTCLLGRMTKKQEKLEKQLAEQRKDTTQWNKNIQKWLYMHAKKRAKTRRLEFSITPDDIPVVHTCPILLIPLQRHIGKLSNNSYSLDRRDSSKGYIPGNVFILSQKANNIKSNLSKEEISRLMEYMG